MKLHFALNCVDGLVEFGDFVAHEFLLDQNFLLELILELLQVRHHAAAGDVEQRAEELIPQALVEVAREARLDVPCQHLLLHLHVRPKQHHVAGPGEAEQIRLVSPRLILQHFAAGEVLGLDDDVEGFVLLVPVHVDGGSEVDELDRRDFHAVLDSGRLK